MSDPRSIPNPRTFRERFGALRTLGPFLAMIWQISPGMFSGVLAMRLIRALVPVATLYVGKLIIDDVVHLVRLPDHPATLPAWWRAGLIDYIALLLLAELALAVLSDVLRRIIALIESLLAEKVTNGSSVRLMQHAATLDLEDFEDAEFQDRLERARRQTSSAWKATITAIMIRISPKPPSSLMWAK